MAIIKCKMCGGNLEIIEGATTATCEYCGSMQTVPKADDEKKLTLFGRANRLRAASEFDKAAGIYETIVADFPEEAEAYWGLVLCRYGIEYVDDPGTGKKIPTCHRTSFTSVLEDSDYEQAMENADPIAKRMYREEAKFIENLRKEIIAVSSKDEPYDIFICYKETDDITKERTLDSVLAQDIYDALTERKYRVFFSRISFEGVLGVEYEPHIFAALHSAKVMLVVGTDPDYLDAVWVKNEWSRFLELMAKDKSKNLVLCFKGLDLDDVPKALSKLQGQDMGKIGAMQDLLHGIEKLLPRQVETVKETVVVQQAAAPTATEPLLKRAFMFLEDGDFARADEFCEQVLNQDPECAMAYVGKLMAELKVKRQDDLKNCSQPFDGNINCQKAIRFGDKSVKAELEGYIGYINSRNEETRKKNTYKTATELVKHAGSDISKYKEAWKQFTSIAGWEDADKLRDECTQRIVALEEEKLQKQMKREQIMARAKKTVIVIACAAAVLALFFMILFGEIIPGGKYNDAVALMKSGKYEEAIVAFKALNGYRDSDVKISACYNAIETAELENKYSAAVELMGTGKYEDALNAFSALDYYKDSGEKAAQCETFIKESKYSKAVALMNEGKYEKAIEIFTTLYRYKDSEEKNQQCKTAIQDGKYDAAVSLMESGKFEEAISAFSTLKGYKDSGEKLNQCYYSQAEILLQSGNKAKAAMTFGKLGDYKDARSRSFGLWDQIAERQTISAGEWHTVAVKTDGTVVTAGSNYYGQCNVEEWTDIIAVAASSSFTIGLRTDGTVVTTCETNAYAKRAEYWTDIVAISTVASHVVGLKSDGTVVACGNNEVGECDVDEWTDIVAVSAGCRYTMGLKADGTVVLNGSGISRNVVAAWENVTHIGTGHWHVVGVKTDHTTLATGEDDDGQCKVANWSNIMLADAGAHHTVGLKNDGTVVAVGMNKNGQCAVGGWEKIVYVDAGCYHTVGIKADGTVVATGKNDFGQCNVSDWTDIMIPQN